MKITCLSELVEHAEALIDYYGDTQIFLLLERKERNEETGELETVIRGCENIYLEHVKDPDAIYIVGRNKCLK